LAFSFLKKKSDEPSLAPPVPPGPPRPPVFSAPKTSSDNVGGLPPLAALPPLPPVHRPIQDYQQPAPLSEVPKAAPPMPTLPPLPAMTQPPAPKSEPKLPPMAELPRISVTSPAMPPLPRQPEFKPLPPLPSLTPAQASPFPPLSSMQREEKLPPLPPLAPLPKTPEPTAPKPLKLENSKLKKALDELNALDVQLPVLDKYEPPKRDKAFEPLFARQQTPYAVKGPLFISLTSYEIALTGLKIVEQHITAAQTRNEKLGIIENHTKAHLDNMINIFEYMQKHLLLVDEKLFRVNS
jgi:hypothetical protein